MRRALPAMLIAGLLVVGALTGCTASATPLSTPTPTATIADTALRPVATLPLTQATAQSETERLADAMVSIVIPSDILYDDDHSVLVPGTDATGTATGTQAAEPAWGVIHTITLDPSLDPSQVAESLIAVLEHSGWVLLHNTADTGTEVIALSSGTKTKESWYVTIAGDASTVGQSVLTIQLLSPAIAG